VVELSADDERRSACVEALRPWAPASGDEVRTLLKRAEAAAFDVALDKIALLTWSVNRSREAAW
jgi:hypothetical protein